MLGFGELGLVDELGAEVGHEHGLELGIEGERRALLEHRAVEEEEGRPVLAVPNGKLVFVSIDQDGDLGHRDLVLGRNEEEIAEGGGAMCELTIERRHNRGGVIHGYLTGFRGRTRDCYRGATDSSHVCVIFRESQGIRRLRWL